MKTLRIQNPQAFTLPAIKDLIDRAFDERWPGNRDRVPAQLAAASLDDNSFVMVGWEDDNFKALVWGIGPTEDWPHAQAAQFFNEGSSALKEALIRGFVDWISQAGCVKFRAVNMRGDDEAWAKSFASAGKATRIGSIMEFDTTWEASETSSSATNRKPASRARRAKSSMSRRTSSRRSEAASQTPSAPSSEAPAPTSAEVQSPA